MSFTNRHSRCKFLRIKFNILVNELVVKGKSRFYVMNNGKPPKRTGGMLWFTYHPGYSYCFIPSLEADKGEARAYDHVPAFVKDFSHHIEIEEVRNFSFSYSRNKYLYCRLSLNLTASVEQNR